MNFNRIGRMLVCLVLICAVVINISPIKAEAVVGEIVAGMVSSPYAVPVLVVAGAIAIALGVQAAQDSSAFRQVVSDTANYLETSTTYVVNGMVNVLGFATADSKVQCFILKDMFQDVLGWFFEQNIVYSSTGPGISYPNNAAANSAIYHASLQPYAALVDFGDGCQVVWSASELVFTLRSDGDYQITAIDGSNLNVWRSNTGWINPSWHVFDSDYPIIHFGRMYPTYVADGLVLGSIQSPFDGNTALDLSELEAYEDYCFKGQLLPPSGKDSDGSDDEKMYLPITIPSLGSGDVLPDEVVGMDQETAQEGSPTPEIDFDFGTGTDTDPGIGGETEIKTDYTTWFQKVVEGITELPQKIANAFKSLLQELFVPDPEFIPNKVEALKAEYKFLDPILSTGEDLKLFFQNIGSQPPIIWIDLGAGTGWYPMGGKVKFIDLTWYAQYKPTVDPIVGGFIWLWVAWRMFKAVPGLLAGDSGTVGAPAIAPDFTFNQARLPAGRSRRKKDGE